MNGTSKIPEAAFRKFMSEWKRNGLPFGLRGYRLCQTRSTLFSCGSQFDCVRAASTLRGPHSEAPVNGASTSSASTRTSCESVEEIRQRLIQQSLEQVPVHGWTRSAVVEAASQLVQDLDGSCSLSIAGLIVEPEDLIFQQMRMWKVQLENDLASIENSDTLSVGERAKSAIQARLSYMRPFLESGRWSTAMAIGMNPLYAKETTFHLNELSTVVGEFCFRGLQTDSFALQAQQASLGAIYVATELHLLTDAFPYSDTWEFLHQRISEWETLWSFSSHAAGEVSNNDTSLPTSLSPTDVLSVALTVSTALASGLQSVVYPQGTAVRFADGSLLTQLKPPKQLPVLPVLGAPPAPLSILWTALFDDNRSFASPDWGTLPSHYGAPAKST